MDGLSLDDLLSGLQAAQQKKSTVRLSERNIIEIVNKLKQLGFLGDDLLHTSNGREYITREKLRQEVLTAIDAAGGRLPLVDLPSSLGVDLAHCERAANEVVSSSKGNIIQAHGDLIATSYFDNMAVDIDQSLQESGIVVVGDVARKCGLGVEMLQNAIQSRIGTLVHGKLDSGIIYTPSFLSRIKSQIRGALRGASTPVMISTLRKDLLKLEGLGGVAALVPGLIEELQSEGSISGKMASGSGSWIPSAFSAAQQDAVKTFYEQNNYVLFDMAAKSGITNPSKYCKESFPTGIILSSACVSPAIVHEMSAAIEDAVQNASWCDVRSIAPSALNNDDVVKLVGECKSSIGSSNQVLASTCIVSSGFLDGLINVLKGEASKAAQEASEARKKKASASSSGGGDGTTMNKRGGKGHAATVDAKKMDDDSDDDDDWSMGKGKGKKGKGGGGGGKRGAAAKGRKNTATTTTASSTSTTTIGDATSESSLFLSSDHLRNRIIALHPDVEYAGIDDELPDALVSHIRPALVTEYERVLSDIFTAGAEKRRRLREAALSRLDSCYQTLQLHLHGAELFNTTDDDNNGGGDNNNNTNNDETYVVLTRHILRSDAPMCVDALIHVLQADVADDNTDTNKDANATPEEIVAQAFTPAVRATAAKSFGGDAREEIAAVVSALTGSNTTVAQFIERLEDASTAVGVRLKKVDKKVEAALVKEKCASLRQQVNDAEDAALVLAGIVPYLISKHRNKCVSLPGKALSTAVDSLHDVLGEEEHGLLKKFHGAVVEHLKRGGEMEESLQNMVGEVKAKLCV